MKNSRRLPVLFLMIVAFLLAGTTAKADSLTLTLAAPFQSGVAGELLTFDATVINNSGATVFLNGDDFTVNSPLVLDDSPFLNNWPLSLGNGGSYAGELFTILIPPGTPVGPYEGTFEITGGADGNAGNVVASADFNVNLAPEPSSLLLLATGLTGLGGVLRRRLVG